MASPLELDHVVIAVQDLAAAEQHIRARGFNIAARGSHPGFGTENVIVQFPSAYLELTHVADARRHVPPAGERSSTGWIEETTAS